MNPFFVYLLKSSISITLLFVLFKVLLQNEKTHVLNRFLLLGILLVSAIIPLFNIQFFLKEVSTMHVEFFNDFVLRPFPEIIPVSAENEIASIPSETKLNDGIFFYGLVVLILFLRVLISVVSVLRIIKNAEKRTFKNIVLAVVKDLIHPFSFINKVILSEKDFNENKYVVVVHEYAHIRKLHAIDLVICELFTLLHFFNPFMWLLRRELKLIHEYQADQAVLQNGIDAKKYQLLVLEKAVGEKRFALANQFTQKPIVKRIKMMSKTKNQKWIGWKLFLFVPVVMVLLQAFARPELITNPQDFIPVKYTENEHEKWLSKWTAENIGKGIFEPQSESLNSSKKPNNVLVILMNRNDDFLIENEHRQKDEIRNIVKYYLLGINPDGKKGPDYQEKEIPFVGKIRVSKGMIVFKHDLASSKEMIDYTLQCIGRACLEVRNEKAQILFGEDYFDLDEEKRQALNEAVPVWFLYDLPNSPTPYVWLSFDEKSSLPKPVNFLFKKNGEVIVQNHKFNSLEEFQELLKVWNKELDEFNKDKRSKGYFRAHITFEDASMEEIKQVDYLLYKNNVHVEQIKQTSSDRNLVSLENKQLSARKDRVLAKAELDKLKNDSTKLSLEEERQRAKTDQSVFQKVKLFASGPVPKEPPAFISVTLEKNLNIVCGNKNYNYNEFETFLKETYKAYRRNLDLKAEVKWDTKVGYQGIHKLAKILDRWGFQDADFRPFNEGGFLPPPDQRQNPPKTLGVIKEGKIESLNSTGVVSTPKVIVRINNEGEYYFGELIYPEKENGNYEIAWNNPLNKRELKEKVEERQRQFNNLKQNSDLSLKELIADVFIDQEAPKNSISEVKEILRETRVVYVNVQ